jgi:hypothetical protein
MFVGVLILPGVLAPPVGLGGGLMIGVAMMVVGAGKGSMIG